MHTTNLRKVGGSVMLAVPPAILNLLNLKADAMVGLVVSDGCLVMRPQSPPLYSLEELLAQCDPSAEMTDEDNEWINGKSVGKELF